MSSILNSDQEKYLEQFRKLSDPLVHGMEKFAAVNKVPILSWQSADLLEILIKMTNPQRVLEIGTAIAYSSIRIARNLHPDAVLQTIEKSKDNIAIAKENIHKSGLQDKIEVLEGDALNVMPGLDKKYDFIFLDADKEDYMKLFNYAMNLLNKNGVIFVDNLLWHGYAAVKEVPENYQVSAKQIREFNQMFTSQKDINSTIIPVGDGIGLGIKK